MKRERYVKGCAVIHGRVDVESKGGKREGNGNYGRKDIKGRQDAVTVTAL